MTKVKKFLAKMMIVQSRNHPENALSLCSRNLVNPKIEEVCKNCRIMITKRIEHSSTQWALGMLTIAYCRTRYDTENQVGSKQPLEEFWGHRLLTEEFSVRIPHANFRL